MDGRDRDHDATPRQSINPNVFDDEFAVDADDLDFGLGVADGFRPAHPSGATRDSQGLQAASSRQALAGTPEPDVRRTPSRNSTAKPPAAREPVAVANDASPAVPARNAGIHARAGSSHATALLHHSSVSSNSSFATMARSESPYGVGPSHPYGMYPQNTTIARSSSGTTSSTIRQPHRSFSAHRPTHPYGMYAQNVSEDQDEEHHITPAPIIPVGFPGLDTGYHRQIGPDGEEQDIIGPDGHTEQLPPYTRYPEEGPTKQSLAAEPSPSPVANVPPRIGASQDALVSPITASNQQTRSEAHILPMSESSGALGSTESGITEKSWRGRTWKNIRRRRVLWGKIRLWVLLLFLGLLLIFAVILGAAIGSIVSRTKTQAHQPSPQSVVTIVSTASMFYASLIPTPSNLSPLPEGTFALPISVPQEQNGDCLTVANQASAWSCTLAGPFLQLIVEPSPDDGLPYASLEPTADDDDDDGIQYGVQPPTLQMQSLQLVIDQDFPTFGPAFHFQGLYNKVVILRNEEFGAGAALRARHQDAPNFPNFHHRFQVQPGDQPWLCYFNQTFIEGYLYVQDNSSAATLTSSSICTTTPAAQTSLPISDTESVTQASISPSPSTTPMPSSSDPYPAMSHFMSYSTSIPLRPRDNNPRPSDYPRVVKVEERRLPGSPQPLCQKMQLLDSGELVPAVNISGYTIQVALQETDPSMQQFSQAGASARGASLSPSSGVTKRDDPPNACHCQWMFP